MFSDHYDVFSDNYDVFSDHYDGFKEYFDLFSDHFDVFIDHYDVFSDNMTCLVTAMTSEDEERLPVLTEEVSNLTMVSGREAVLSCHVSHLGSYKVSLSWFLQG